MASLSSPESTPPPPESALAVGYASADLVDAFAISLPAETTRDVHLLAIAILANPATWVRSLMRMRDGVMGKLGVKTSRQIRAGSASAARDRIDFFPIVSRAPRELVVGENDRHLDFRTSVLVR